MGMSSSHDGTLHPDEDRSGSHQDRLDAGEERNRQDLQGTSSERRNSSDEPTPTRRETDEWNKCQELLSRFEKDWQQAEWVDLEDYLRSAEPAKRIPLLHELIKSELEIRWRRGGGLTLEDYLRCFPELGRRDDLPPDLIQAEYVARVRHGDRPSLDEYQERFPNQYDALVKMVEADPEAQDLLQAARDVGDAAPELPPYIDYRLVRRLGKGNFGEVWLANAPGGFMVAFKIVRPFATIEQEGLDRIKNLHPHSSLVQTHAYWIEGDCLYVAMELAEKTLADRLKECRKEHRQGVPVEELLGYFTEAADGLDYLNGQQISHGDIKPANILLCKGHAKIADFGVVRRVDGTIVFAPPAGTPALMGPEVWDFQLSKFSDQFSLAVTWGYCRLGRFLFPGPDIDVLKTNIKYGKPNLDGLEPEEQKVLRKALAKNPRARYSSCSEMVAALRAALEKKPDQTWKRLALLGAAAVLMLVGGVLLYGWIFGWNRPPPVGKTTRVPPGFKQVGGGTVDVPGFGLLPEVLETDRDDCPPLCFRLIWPVPAGAPLDAPYYMMEAKVSNRVMAAFDRGWPTDPRKGGLPAFGMTVDQALACAVWIGGELPSVDQWDLAAGFWDRQGRNGPALGKRVAVGLRGEGPWPVDASPTDDISPFGIRDMAGNGLEFTRNVTRVHQEEGPAPDAVRVVPLDRPRPEDLVILRGNRLNAAAPLSYATLEAWRNPRNAMVQNYSTGSPFTGFRVVLELERLAASSSRNNPPEGQGSPFAHGIVLPRPGGWPGKDAKHCNLPHTPGMVSHSTSTSYSHSSSSRSCWVSAMISTPVASRRATPWGVRLLRDTSSRRRCLRSGQSARSLAPSSVMFP